MKRNNYFFLLLAFLFCKVFAQSPITLNNTHFPGMNDTLRYSLASVSISPSYTQTGTNFTWNFNNLVPIAQGRRDYKHALQTPYAFFFIGINEYGEKVADSVGAGPLVIKNLYNFYKKQTSPVNCYLVDGSGMTFSSVPVPSYFSDKDELYMFPMSYPKYDSTTFKFSTPSSSLIPIVYSKTGYRVSRVDGWGTITTPYGTAPCLRYVTTQYSQDSIKNSFFPIPFGFPNNQRSYQWLTTTSKIPFLEITGNLVGNVFTITMVRYRDIYHNLTGAREEELASDFMVYPNPATDYLEMPKDAYKSVQLFNIQGQLLYSAEKQTINDNKLDLRFLPSGVYHGVLSYEYKQTVFKFIKP